MVIVKICQKCGKVKHWKEFIPVPKELQIEIDREAISVDILTCPDCSEPGVSNRLKEVLDKI